MRSMLMGSASPFAHLAGLGRRRKGARAEDAPADDDKDKARRARAEEGDEDKDDDKDKGARAEEDGDDKDKVARAEEGDEDKDDDKDKAKARRARADGDEDDDRCEDDDDEEMRGKSAVAMARGRERSRCEAILKAASGPEQIELACRLAFKTSLPRSEAIAALQDGGSRSSRADLGRQARNPDLGTGGGQADPKKAMAGLWDKAFARAGIKTRT